MIAHTAVLLLFQLAGEAIAVGLDLPLPGPVIGMVLLFLALLIREAVGMAQALPDGFAETAQGLLAHLSLLFVPAGVGVIVHVALIRDAWVAITVALVLSTLVTVAATGAVLAALLPRDTGARDDA